MSCPVVAMGYWPSGLATGGLASHFKGFTPLPVRALGESDAVAAGLTHVGVVQESVDGGGEAAKPEAIHGTRGTRHAGGRARRVPSKWGGLESSGTRTGDGRRLSRVGAGRGWMPVGLCIS